MNRVSTSTNTSFRCSIEQRDRLFEIAAEQDCYRAGKPNLSGLLSKIADGELKLGGVENRQLIDPLERAVKLLCDNGLQQEAQRLGQYLLDYDLSGEQRANILAQIYNSQDGWRQQIDKFIADKSTFMIIYSDGQGQRQEFTVEYAQVDFIEKRFYLNCWVREVGSNDFPELAHNRCLRFDRVAGLRSMSGKWRTEGLGMIKVSLKFQKGMVKSYEPRVNDTDDRTEGSCRFVCRMTNNPFWLIREVLRYGDSCELLEPEVLRDRVKEQLIANLALYK